MIKRILMKVVLPVLLAISLPAEMLMAQEVDIPVPDTDGKKERKIEAMQEVTKEYKETFSLDVSVFDMSDETQPEGVPISVEDAGLQYSSDNEEIVSVTEDEQSGEVTFTAVGVGDTDITVTAPETEEYSEVTAVITIHVVKAKQIVEAENITVTYGFEPFKLNPKSLGGEYSYELVDGSNVISLKEDGTVSCKKTGNATVRITASETGEYEEAVTEITVTVKTTLDKGTFQEGAIAEGGIQLKWNKISRAEGYYLYRSKTGKSPWSKIKTFTDAGDTEYLDNTVKPGEKYYYRVKAYTSSGNDTGETGETVKFVYVLPPTVGVTLSPTGNRIQWNKPAGAGGYLVYRRENEEEEWTEIESISEPGEVAWVDTSAENGKIYYYTVRTVNGDSVSVYAPEKSYVRVSSPTVKSWKRLSSTQIRLSWNKNASASGYQIQYSRSSVFASKKTVTVKDNSILTYTASKLKKNQKYYARIRAYQIVDGKTYYSPWSASGNITSTKTLKASVLKQKKKVFEIISWAKQNMSQYAVLQGSCTDGTYAYYLLYNSYAEKCKIVKVKMSTLKVVKVSGVLNVAHGNDMTYNSQKKILVIVHSTGSDPKALTSVNPDTLKIKESRHITIPNKLSGGTVTDAKNATAFTGLAYSAGRQEYALLLSHNYNFVILDSDLNPVRYVKVTKKNNYTMQGIDATDDYILVAQSPKTSSQKYNIITVYDWEGNYISKMNVKKGYEIESIYHVGSKYYAGFYRSYYKTYYKNVIKTVKVNGKTKKKKVKVKYRKFCRADYVYRITGL
ncbi:MAG: hypothetical protein ACI4S2_07635 [Lachnospiraceae bacterium]